MPGQTMNPRTQRKPRPTRCPSVARRDRSSRNFRQPAALKPFRETPAVSRSCRRRSDPGLERSPANADPGKVQVLPLAPVPP